MTEASKRTLQSILGKLLGFDDGAEDVLEHLLTIDSTAVRFVCHDVSAGFGDASIKSHTSTSLSPI